MASRSAEAVAGACWSLFWVWAIAVYVSLSAIRRTAFGPANTASADPLLLIVGSRQPLQRQILCAGTGSRRRLQALRILRVKWRQILRSAARVGLIARGRVAASMSAGEQRSIPLRIGDAARSAHTGVLLTHRTTGYYRSRQAFMRSRACQHSCLSRGEEQRLWVAAVAWAILGSTPQASEGIKHCDQGEWSALHTLPTMPANKTWRLMPPGCMDASSGRLNVRK